MCLCAYVHRGYAVHSPRAVYMQSLFVHVMHGSLAFPGSQATHAVFCNALGPASVVLLRNEIAFQMLLSFLLPSSTRQNCLHFPFQGCKEECIISCALV